MPSSRFITHNARGMAMSIDALLAVVLFIALVAFISLEPVSEIPITQPRIAVNQLVDDAVAAMDSTGFIMQSIESGDAGPIETKLQALLAENIGFRLEMLQYESTLDEPGNQCRTNKDFETCFPDLPTEFFTVGEEIPVEKEIFHGKKIFIKKQPGDCEDKSAEAKPKSAKELIAYFQGNPPVASDVNITIGSCPAEYQSCPAVGDSLYCCYDFHDPDAGDTEGSSTFKWFKYNETTEAWDEQTGETSQTLGIAVQDSNRWKCEVTPKDNHGVEGSPAESRVAIIGGPCFSFTATVDDETLHCGATSTVSITADAMLGGTRNSVDIMMVLDSSGSMGWCSPAEIKDGTSPLMDLDFENGEKQSGAIGSDLITDSGQVGDGEVYCSGGWGSWCWGGEWLPVKATFQKIYEFEKTESSPFLVTTTWSPACSGGWFGWESWKCPKMYVKNTDTETEYGYYGGTPPGGSYSPYTYSSSQIVILASEPELGTWEVWAWSYDTRNYTLHFSTPEFQEAFTFNIDSTDDFSASLRWYDVCSGLCPKLWIDGPSGQSYGYGQDNTGVTYDSTGLDDYILVPGSSSNIGLWTAYVLNDGPDIVYDFLVNYPHWEELGVITIENDYSFDLFLTWDTPCYHHCPEMQIEKGGTIYGYNGTPPTGSRSTPSPDDESCYEYLGKRIEEDFPQSQYLLVPGDSARNGDWTVGVWTDGAHSYNMKAKYVDGRISSLEAVKGAAIEFVTNPGLTPQWGDDVGDQMGLATYNNTVTIKNAFQGWDGHLAPATDSHLSNNIVNGINQMGASGRTATGDAMKESTDELLCSYATQSKCEDAPGCNWTGSSCEIATRNDIQFMVLLTDGRTNCCASDGCGGIEAEIYCKSEALGFANAARDAGIRIYIIGFGANVDEEELLQYAYDEDSYWNATDPDALQLVYEEIAQKIGEEAGIMPEENSTKILMINIQNSFDVSSPACDSRDAECTASWDPDLRELRFENMDIAFDNPDWTGTFDVTPICDYGDCDPEKADGLVEGKTLRFPPEDTTITFDLGGSTQDPLEWPSWDAILAPFHYRDLKIEFVGGKFYGITDTAIDYKIKNRGYETIDLEDIGNPTVEFYYDETSAQGARPEFGGQKFYEQYLDSGYFGFPPILLPGNGNDETSPFVDATANLDKSGYICLYLNQPPQPEGVIECWENNWIVVNCAIPKTFVYVLDYWAWEK